MQGNIKKILTKNNINYALLDYVLANGTQYLDTGFKPNQNTSVECEYYMDNQANNPIFFGATSAWETDVFSFYRGSEQIYSGYGNADQNISVQNYGKHKVLKDKNKCYVDGTLLYTHATQTFQSSNNLVIGRVVGRSSYLFYGRIYYFKLWDNGTLKKHYVPVERMSDGKIGLLDLVDGTLEGTGNWVKGNYLQVEHIYKTHITKDNEEVEEVEYIQSNNGQFINTGVSGGTKAEYEIKFNNTGSIYQNYGTYFSGGSATYYIPKLYTNGTNANILEVNWTGGGKSISGVSNIDLTIKCKNKQFIVNDVVQATISDTGNWGSKQWTISAPPDETQARAKMKIYYCKMYDNDKLIRDLIPVKVKSTNEYCMLDLVENKLYHNAGTGTFTGGNLVEVEKIEEVIISNNTMYYKLDYLQSSGTQYLTTNIKPNGNERFEIDFTPLEWSTTYNNVVCGARNSGTYGIYVFGSIADAYGGGSRLANFGYNQNFATKPTLNVKHKVKYEKEKMWLDGTQYTATGRALSQLNIHMTIFAGNTEGQTVSGQTKMKLHSFIIYNADGTIKENWIPAERVSDNVKGMLDTLSGTFYTNSGTGTFTGNRKEIILVE